jgi:hypothetical protein
MSSVGTNSSNFEQGKQRVTLAIKENDEQAVITRRIVGLVLGHSVCSSLFKWSFLRLFLNLIQKFGPFGNFFTPSRIRMMQIASWIFFVLTTTGDLIQVGFLGSQVA